MPVVVSYRVDWFRVIDDITRRGISLYEIAKWTDISKSALIGWKQGSHPSHHNGETLIDFWCMVTNKERKLLPQVVSKRRFVYESKRRVITATNEALSA
ncbi:hypothetical protein ABIC80_001304 [Kosakonia sp. 1610]